MAVYTHFAYYRQRFERNRGPRIDFVLGSPTFAERVTVPEDLSRAGALWEDAPVVVVDGNLITSRWPPPTSQRSPQR